MCIRDSGGTPAVDRRADELLGGDEQRETDEHGDRVEATQPVSVVVVRVSLPLAHAQRRLEQTIHRHRTSTPSSSDNRSIVGGKNGVSVTC